MSQPVRLPTWATKAVIWWAIPIIATSAGPVLTIVSVGRSTGVRATQFLTSRFGCGLRSSLLGPHLLDCVVGGGRLIPSRPPQSALLPSKETAHLLSDFFGHLVSRIWSLGPERHKGTYPHTIILPSRRCLPLAVASIKNERAWKLMLDTAMEKLKVSIKLEGLFRMCPPIGNYLRAKGSNPIIFCLSIVMGWGAHA